MEIIQFFFFESEAEHADFVDYGLFKDVISLKQVKQRELIHLSSQTAGEQPEWNS